MMYVNVRYSPTQTSPLKGRLHSGVCGWDYPPAGLLRIKSFNHLGNIMLLSTSLGFHTPPHKDRILSWPQYSRAHDTHSTTKGSFDNERQHH